MSFLPGIWLHPKASQIPGRTLIRFQAEADRLEAGGLYPESGNLIQPVGAAATDQLSESHRANNNIGEGAPNAPKISILMKNKQKAA